MQQASSSKLTDKQKSLLKDLTEKSMNMRIDSDNDRVSYMQLIYDGLVSSFGTLTEKGIAFAVIYCGASFTKFIDSHPYLSGQYTALLNGCSAPEEIDGRAFEYYQKRARQL